MGRGGCVRVGVCGNVCVYVHTYVNIFYSYYYVDLSYFMSCSMCIILYYLINVIKTFDIYSAITELFIFRHFVIQRLLHDHTC